MPVLLPCAVKTHYSWSFGNTYGPTTYPNDNHYFDCFCGYNIIEDDGGNAGFSLTFPVNNGCNTNARWRITGTRGGDIADRIRVYRNGTEIWTSDCAATDFDSGNYTLAAGTETMQIVVNPKCDGAPGVTYWSFYFTIDCT
jgi:hypothetical protein